MKKHFTIGVFGVMGLMVGLFAAVPIQGFAEGEPNAQASAASKPDTMQIQKALAQAGYYQGTIDGIIGPKTRRAIRSFQEANGLKVDGKCGPLTWEKLKVYAVEPAATDQAVDPLAASDEGEILPAADPTSEGDALKQKLVY